MATFDWIHAWPLLLSLSCGSPPAPSEPSASSTAVPESTPEPVSPPTPSPEPNQASLESIVHRSIASSEVPTGIVVLDADGRLVTLVAIGGAQPGQQALRPGSTVKPLLALGAARAGTLPSKSYTCQQNFPPVEGLTCFQSHGALDLPSAIEQSCNVYFYDIGHRLGMSGVHAVFRHYGFGASTGLVEGENPGRMPGEAELRQRQPDPDADELWPAFAPMIGIGHGPIQVTLLQLTRAYAQLAAELTNGEEPELVGIKQQILSGMRRVVEGELGTGRTARVPGLDIAGKTGMAEPGQFDDEASQQGAHNGWFVAFAPAEKPELVVGVVCLGGLAKQCAAPLVGSILSEALAPPGETDAPDGEAVPATPAR